MLDVVDFIEERGGDPKKIKESQRRRFAPEEAVDEVIALYEDHRTSARSDYQQCASWIAIANLHTAKYEAQQIGSKINATQKEIGARKKVGYWKSALGSTPYMAYTFLGRRKKMLVYSSIRKPS